MNIHRGELLKKYFVKSGLSRVIFCNSLGITDNTLTNWFNTPELGFEKLMMAAPFVLHDFSEEIPLLKFLSYDRKNEMIILTEPVEAYQAANDKSIQVIISRLDEQDIMLKEILRNQNKQ